jgi:DNA polymerase III delta prime subunit
MSNTEFLWTEKYRPKTVDECILPADLKKTLNALVKGGQLPNLLFTGTAGLGKTTVAKALCNMLGLDYILINGSEESGIDVLRNKIKQFASTVSLSGGYKVVILDEADYLNPTSTMPALRGFIEEFSNNCRFILTCNFKNRIIPPLHSRTAVIEFKLPKSEKPKIASAFFKRVMEIMAIENIESDGKVIAKVIEKHFPDYRRVLNELQRYSASGKIDEGIFVSLGESNMQELISSLKDGDWKKMRTWVVNNIDNDPQTIFRKLYDTLTDHVTQVPQLILLLADYQYKAAFCADQEINLVACLTEIMAAVEFK